MKHFVTTAAFLATTLIGGAPAMADDMNPVDTATQYFIALYAGETDTVRELAATDMAFQDPTAPDAYGVPILNELEPVLDLFSGFSGDSVNVDITNAYASNDQVVLTFELSGTLPGASLGMEVETISFESNGVTVLQVTDGQVVSHTDYVNYPRFEGSITPVQ